MDPRSLESDEVIVKKASRVIVRGARYEVILTSRRLILSERESGTVRRSVPYGEISLAASGVNTLREPVLHITAAGESGDWQDEIVFVHLPGGENVRDLEKCLAVLREHRVPVKGAAMPDADEFTRRSASPASGLLNDDNKPERRRTPDQITAMRPWQTRQMPSEEARQKSQFMTTISIIAVIAILILGAFAAGQVLKPKPPAVHQAPVTPAAVRSPVPTATSGPAPASTPSPASTPGETSPAGTVPPYGIWAKISYPGYYAGNVEAEGWRTQVNATGISIIQLPVQDTTIYGSIEKSDGSGERLEVEVYNGGTLVAKTGTAKPFGVIDLHIPVGPAAGTPPAVTPAPAAAAPVPTPDSSMVLREIPTYGVWIRVAYPGAFSGSVAANGGWREIRGSGDQLYQLSMKNGVAEAAVRKDDKSDRNLIVELYKDGSLVTYTNTTTPDGVAEIHTRI